MTKIFTIGFTKKSLREFVDAYKKDCDWPRYEDGFNRLLAERRQITKRLTSRVRQSDLGRYSRMVSALWLFRSLNTQIENALIFHIRYSIFHGHSTRSSGYGIWNMQRDYNSKFLLRRLHQSLEWDASITGSMRLSPAPS
jgi:hypothetical protein